MLETLTETSSQLEVEFHDLRIHTPHHAQRIIRDIINQNNRNRLALSIGSDQLSDFPTSFVLVNEKSKTRTPYWDGIVINLNQLNFRFGVYYPDTPDFSCLTILRRAAEDSMVAKLIEVNYELVRGLFLKASKGIERIFYYVL